MPGAETLAAIGVSAAGTMAGGYAASALMGEEAPYTGGGISGVTATKSSGKNDTMAGIPQVDNSQALQWFQQAADAQAKGYQEGLNYYSAALKNAGQAINAGMGQANATLRPMSSASNAAMNEQLKMMGLPPITATAPAADLAKGYGLSPQLQTQMANAERITDPIQRAAAKEQIIQGLQKSATLTSADQAVFIDQAKKELGAPPQLAGIKNPEAFKNPADLETAKAYNQQQYAAQMAEYNKKLDTLVGQKGTDAYNANLQKVQELTNMYNNQYSPEAARGYTGAEVINKLEQTPGYQFNLDQGTRAIERQGAAKGMLGSTNTQLALQQYGQGLAQSTYQSYMQNLANITAQGAGATSQIAGNQYNTGQFQSQLQQAGGQAQMQTSRDIANAQASALQNQAQLYAQTAQYNAGLQNQAYAQQNAQQSQMAQQAISSAPGYMQANQQQQESASYGQGFLSGNNVRPQGQGWITGSNGWPTYTGIKV